MLKNKLHQIGLSKNEAIVYISLLEQGPCSITKIAEHTQIKRAQVYGILETLTEKKLISTGLAGKRKVYAAETPQYLQQLLVDKLEMLDGLLPELITLSNNSDRKPIMRYVEGVEGIKTIYLASAAAKEKQLYAFVGVESLTQRSKSLERFWDGVFQKRRKQNGVVGRIIVPDNAAGKAFKRKDKINGRESRMVPASNYNFSAEILVYDDTVSFISYTKKEEFALSVESKSIASTVKMIWRIVWNASY